MSVDAWLSVVAAYLMRFSLVAQWRCVHSYGFSASSECFVMFFPVSSASQDFLNTRYRVAACFSYKVGKTSSKTVQNSYSGACITNLVGKYSVMLVP